MSEEPEEWPCPGCGEFYRTAIEALECMKADGRHWDVFPLSDEEEREKR